MQYQRVLTNDSTGGGCIQTTVQLTAGEQSATGEQLSGFQVFVQLPSKHAASMQQQRPTIASIDVSKALLSTITATSSKSHQRSVTLVTELFHCHYRAHSTDSLNHNARMDNRTERDNHLRYHYFYNNQTPSTAAQQPAYTTTLQSNTTTTAILPHITHTRTCATLTHPINNTNTYQPTNNTTPTHLTTAQQTADLINR